MILINKLLLSLCVGLFSLGSYANNDTAADQIAQLVSKLSDYQTIVITVSYVIGVFLLWGVFNSLKSFSDSGSQETMGGILTRLIIAVGFIAFGFLMTSISASY